MNVVDVVLAIALLVFALAGWRRGFVYGLLSLAGFLLGALFGLWLAPKMVAGWDPGIGKAGVAFVVVLLSAFLGQVVVGLVGKRAKERITWRPAELLDSSSGAVLAVVAMLMVAWLMADVYASGNRSALARDARQSNVLGFVDQFMPQQAFLVTGQLESMLTESGFPQVFAGLRPEPVVPVGAPRRSIVRQEAVVRSAAQTLKILGDASKCQRRLEGTGFGFAEGRVMTNAHVVAGVDSPEVLIGGSGRAYEARVVYFDPDVDLAVLAVPDLPASSLTFERTLERGQPVAVVGYPESGPLTVEPGRVRSQEFARGNDIYGTGTVVREVISLRASVRPGNSGGPVLDRSGRVLGVVFANSLDRNDTGYALTADQVAPAVAAGVTAVKAVDTGPCT